MSLFKDKEAREKIAQIESVIGFERNSCYGISACSSKEIDYIHKEINKRFNELYDHLGVEPKIIPTTPEKTILVKKKAKGK